MIVRDLAWVHVAMSSAGVRLSVHSVNVLSNRTSDRPQDEPFNIRFDDNFEIAKAMWPDDEVVSWLFFNVFQFTKVSDDQGRGDCPGGLDKIYQDLMNSFDSVPEWESIPWGLGAWGTNGEN